MYQQGKIKTQIRKTDTNIKFQKSNGLSLKLVLENPKIHTHFIHQHTNSNTQITTQIKITKLSKKEQKFQHLKLKKHGRNEKSDAKREIRDLCLSGLDTTAREGKKPLQKSVDDQLGGTSRLHLLRLVVFVFVLFLSL